MRARWTIPTLLLALAATVAACTVPAPVDPDTPPVVGYEVETVAEGLRLPTNLEFAPGGRIFVAEQAGTVQTFDGVDDPTPTLAVDVSDEVASFNDLGLLALAVDPSYPARPFLYLMYTTDPSGRYGDACPSPPGAYVDGCPMSARITRVPVDPTTGLERGPEQVLLADRWCFQFPTHGPDDLVFLPDRTLLASAGDGGAFSDADIGRLGGSPLSPTPRNPCGDPPGGVGSLLSAPTAEGGALRSQDVLTGTDPTGFNGAVIRIDPDTGAPVAGNPLVGVGPLDDDALIAHGLRNPFRLAVRPGTDEVWIGDVGWNSWEELDRIDSATDDAVENFGWPCREGPDETAAYASLHLDLCARAVAPTAPTRLTEPHFAYPRSGAPDTERCGAGGMSISGVAFLGDAPYPAPLRGALVFSDYVRGCVWAMSIGADGRPDPGQVVTLATGRVAVDVEVGTGGFAYLLDIARGTIDRIRPETTMPPEVVLTASPDAGPVPLAVTFGTEGSTDPSGGALSFAWDLDGDGDHDDATGPSATRAYTSPGDVTVGVRATSSSGGVTDATRVVHAGNSRPTVRVTAGPNGWSVGQPISFSAVASDAEDGPLTGTSVSWAIEVRHCQTTDDCHTHTYQTATGTSGSVAGPDHDLPSYVVLRATARDSAGLTASDEVRLDPRTVTVNFASFPDGLQVGVGSTVATAPFTRTFIVGSRRTVTAPVPQTWNRLPVGFWFWSDGGARSHDVTFTQSGTWLAAFSL
ncbi:PQQ-dependent sugar dehydrogenase [Dermatobacter hominis]|uniref:PQQ-dependent sugar dehydrogenase n=1 Tax=Dermatobacter hominis TaxID=2884263 RepID=UPI001D100D69|nr:PQQ-dependent sugar dehydrogenase [Dermatobacter hominis]UDY34649.1 PQQ-dependent sugar dehydrogenase [Dermatobacter hominis]